ncbi:hypothetical protein LMG3410_02041 [Achromobacter aegrifaciens]|nr:hypothetical protein LMG3410_02041 [Achromobacter aegrifaciens]
MCNNAPNGATRSPRKSPRSKSLGTSSRVPGKERCPYDEYLTPRDAAGQESYIVLAISADKDPLFQNYHQAGKEKCIVVILTEGGYQDWLTAEAQPK